MSKKLIKKIQSECADTWRVYMYFPSKLYFDLKLEAPEEGYTKRELYYDHHVKDYIISLLGEMKE